MPENKYSFIFIINRAQVQSLTRAKFTETFPFLSILIRGASDLILADLNR